MKAGTGKEATARRRARFVDAVIANGGNATQAAIAAGYSEKTARQQAARLLSDVSISAAIAQRSRALTEQFELSAERTLREMARLAYFDIRSLFNADGTLKAIHELDEDTAAAIASVEVDEILVKGVVVGHTKKVRIWDKNSALDKAMRCLGLYERDNRQLADPIRELIEKITTGGSRFKVAGTARAK